MCDDTAPPVTQGLRASTEGLQTALAWSLRLKTLSSRPETLHILLPQPSAMLQECYRALHAFGVHQEDSLPGNFVLVGERLTVVGFEKPEIDKSADDNANYMAACVSDVLDKYTRLRKLWRFEGSLRSRPKYYRMVWNAAPSIT